MKPIEKVTLSIGQWNGMQLKMQNMEDALSFYANGDNYDENETDMYTIIKCDYGNKARKALGIPND